MEVIVRSVTGIVAGVCLGQSVLKMFPLQSRRWKRVSIYLLLGVAIAIPSWVGDENPILLFPFFMLGFLLLLPGEKLPKLIMGGIFFSLLMPMNMLIDSLYWHGTSQTVSLGCKALVCCALAWLLWRILPGGELRLSKKLWLLLGGLTLTPLVSMLSFSIWGNTFENEEQYQFYELILRRFAFTVLPFVMISALALLISAVVLSRHEALSQESELATLREVYYVSLKQEQVQLRTLRHDLRNHLTAIQGLLAQGKQTQAAAYLSHLSDSPALAGGKRYTANEAANVVLTSKSAQMAAVGLTPDFEVSLPESFALPAPELCALLGNSLDNAIEGAANAKNRTITLRVRLEKGVFMLLVQNAVSGAVNPDLTTTKANAARHGFGLAGMREIARRHGGSLEATANNGSFELLVCFPCM